MENQSPKSKAIKTAALVIGGNILFIGIMVGIACIVLMNTEGKLKVVLDGTKGELSFVYDNETILKAGLKMVIPANPPVKDTRKGCLFSYELETIKKGNTVTRRCLLRIEDTSGDEFALSGEVSGYGAFPCAPEKNERLEKVIRVCSGPSASGLNNGIYCPADDWAIEFTHPRLSGFEYTGSAGEKNRFEFSVTGKGEIVIDFKPGFYKYHRGLEYYEGGTSHIRDSVPSAWISWKAYGGAVTEDDVTAATEWCADNLGDYGLTHIIVDDGWFTGQTAPGAGMYNVPPGIDWTKANRKFPSGINGLAEFIHDGNLKAGIWMSPFGFSGDPEINPDYWIRYSGDGQFLYNEWHGFHYCDASNNAAVDAWLTRGVKAQRANGIDFFKLDGMYHVAYEGYREASDYFKAKGMRWQEALRTGWKALIKAADGGYVLSCWGRVPEIAGIPNAIRIGQDKGSEWIYVTIAAEDLRQYLYEHNIVWTADPDHIVFGNLQATESRTWATLVGVTGTLLSFSDVSRSLTEEKLSILRHVLPVIGGPAVRPLNLFPYEKRPDLWLLEIVRPFDEWVVVADMDMGDPPGEIDFSEIGLKEHTAYTVFDFWNDRFLGVYENTFPCGGPAARDTQLFCIKEMRDHPWVISVNRHISQGGVSIVNMSYENGQLNGMSRIVKDDPYILSLYTHGRTIDAVSAGGGCEYELEEEGWHARLTLRSPRTGEFGWSVSFGEKNIALEPIRNEELNPAMEDGQS
ncbi:MAG: alpha-galactosidase [Spirochaetales bacterium]|nr:alpha-galactosidase [Spirochaetales bacterium]